jgi:membrane fusion protein (multidrug efflux system)
MRRSVAGVVALVGLFAGCRHGALEEAAGPPQVEVAVARAEDVPVDVSAVASLESPHSAELRAQVAGQITKLYVDEGARVAAGGAILAIDPERYHLVLQSAQAHLEQAQAQYANDSLTLARSRPLVATGGIGPQAFDDLKTRVGLSKANLDQARAARDIARQDDLNASVLAPFAGRFAEREVNVGDYVKVGDPLGIIADASVLQLTFHLPETEAVDVRSGDPVDFNATAVPDHDFSGTVFYVSPIVDPGTRTVTVKARVRNEKGLLRPGMSATADVSTRELHDAAVIPEVAVRREAGEQYVFRMASDTVSRIGVTLGPRPRPGDIVITGGIAVGDTVLVAGFQKVTDGTRVNARLPLPAAPADSAGL